MATHDFDTAESVVDEAVCLSNGRLAPIAPTGGSLRARYRQAVEQASA
jgi:hypothetical protein